MTAAKSRTAGLPDVLPVLPLRSTMVYPMGVVGVQIGTPTSLEVLDTQAEPNLVVAVVVAPGGPDDPIDPGDLRKVAVAARVSDRLNLPGGIVQATLQGLQRVRLSDLHEREGHYVAEYTLARERPAGERSARELIARILSALEALSGQVERIPREVPRILRMNLGDPGRFADLVATLANFSLGSKDRVLQQLTVGRRLSFVRDELEAQVQRVQQMSLDATALDSSTDTAGERARDLRRRIQILQAELGEVDPIEAEAVALLRSVEMAGLPVRAATRARAEIERLRSSSGSSDVAETRDYIDWLLGMPWHRSASDGLGSIDLDRIQAELDRELLGLDEPKERLLDHLAVAKLRGQLSGPIPCFVGPPAVGKTALARALGHGLGRPLVRLDLGGKGEADLLGQRRSRGGGQAGNVASLLRDARVNDPVMLLGEVDELVTDKADGDPSRALAELLDGAHLFDRYLDVPFSLDRVLFLAVAQDFHRVPRVLRDLMVEIRIAGYTPEEKVDMARRRLIPRLIERHGLKRGHVSFPGRGLSALAYGYARDAGLGMMRRSIETLLRTRARARARGDTSRWVFDAARIEEILGTPRYIVTPAESTPEIGVVTGLAWTAAGGELMFIEALRMPGTGRLIITGMLGDVMRESVNAAYSYVRSRGPELGITEDDFRDSDVHVHFPVGAIPKDGPSAGIAVTLAIASTLSERPIRHDIAMTGEVTLRGKVLEVGGVKEKVLAAHRADIRQVILPAGNSRELRDVPDNVRESIEFHFVDRMDDVVQLALHGSGRDSDALVRLAPPTSPPRAAGSGKHGSDAT